MPHTFTDVACTVCGCVCDDLRVSVTGGRVLSADGACSLAKPWFASLNDPQPPIAEVNDSPVSLAEAYSRAGELLKASKYPLVYGLSRSTTEGQRAATALADKLGATIDTTASTGHAPSIMALQQVGESTCTLGEVRQRADVVVFWGSDPLVTHPRHIDRYCPPRPGRKIIVVDTRETETAKAADLFVPVTAGCQWEAVWELRLRVADSLRESVPMSLSERATHPTGLTDLASLLRSAKFGVVFFGSGITSEPLAHRTVEALLQLVTDLNNHTRFYARRMRRYGDVAGADSVLAWQTGYPFGVNLSAGYPRYNPGEFTGPEMLARGEPDLCVLVGSETAADFPPAATEHLRSIPVIALDPPHVRPPFIPAVRFTTAVYGVHRPGTAYRMDEVAIPLRTLIESDYPSDGEVLAELLRRVGERGASAP
jgi:formylmethanofuran dehydrogenase subunit B